MTRDASAGVPAFIDVTNNGPQGNINPYQYTISSVATDTSDATGNTAYVTVMGFTGGTGHIWKTTNSGATWTDFTGNLPDAPVNAVAVYPPMSLVFVGTDVGVFSSSTTSPGWTEVGPNPSTNLPGYLPNVSVTGLGVFASGGQQLLRASTYGRGIWQFNLVITPDFQISVPTVSLTTFAGQSATFSGTVTAQNGYTNSVTLSCVPDGTNPPSTCSASPATLTPASKTPFTLTVGGSAGDYAFDLQAYGSDPKHITHKIPLTLHLVSFGLTTPSPAAVTVNRGSTSFPVSFQVTAAGSFNQSVTVSCSTSISNATCGLTPGATVAPTSTSPVNMTASVAVPAETVAGSYSVTIQAASAGAPSVLSTSFSLNVTANPDFTLSESGAFPEVNAGSSGTTGPISINSQDGFSGAVALSCQSTSGTGTCGINPSSVNSFPATATLTINAANVSAGNYSVSVSGKSGSTTHSVAIPFSVGDYSIYGTQALSSVPGGQVTANLKFGSLFSYAGKISAACDATALPGAMCTLSGNSVTLTSGGEASLSASVGVPKGASAGTYNIKINTHDFGGFPAHSAIVALTLAQDFLLTSSTQSQTVTAGQTSGPYNLRVQPVGASFDFAVSLVCSSGLPSQAQCVFSPAAPVTPGVSGADVVMSISTKAKANLDGLPGRGSMFFGLALLLPGAFIFWIKPKQFCPRRTTLLSFVVLVAIALLFAACGGVSAGGGGTGIGPTNPVTYHVTVTGTSAGTPADAGQSTVVTLVVD